MDERNLDFLDVLNVMSFVIGIMNYNENLTQGDKQDIMQNLSLHSDKIIDEIHAHLESQDKKLDEILEVLSNEKNQEVSRPDSRRSS